MQKLSKQFWFKPALLIATALILLLNIPNFIDIRVVHLWTDNLIYFLVATMLLLSAYIRRTEHLRNPWMRVFRQRRAMVALVVLCTFILIGLLDSFHFRKPLPQLATEQGQPVSIQYSVEVLSLLDVMLDKLRTRQEKSYSSPFATHLYAKESVSLADGSQVRQYPRLVYGGAHLQNPQTEISADILRTSARGVLTGIVITLGLCFALILLLSIRSRQRFSYRLNNIIRGRSEIPWRSIFVTSGVVLIIFSTLFVLSDSYHVFGTDKVGQ
ncbi:hypothetical protein, partial [Kaarinaea lacus]